MFRRRFLQMMTVATAGGLAPLEGVAARASRIVTYRVKGFSCITCATGLDTMLSQQKGITSSKSTYPQGKVTVGFDPEQTTEKAIVAFIADLGFTVEGEHQDDFLPPSERRQSKPQPRN
jgi:copper chaperone CopZ